MNIKKRIYKTKNRTVGLRFSDSDYEKLRKRAEENKLKIASYSRKVILDKLDETK